MDTVREKIITAFTQRAAPLSTLTIERARRSMNESNARFITIWDGDDQVLESGFAVQKLQFPIVIECVFKAALNENPSVTANALIGEVIKTMFTGSHTLGGLASAINLQSTSPTYPQDGSDYITLQIAFLIIYTTVKGDPYTAL
jgi:hypothetical protein